MMQLARTASLVGRRLSLLRFQQVTKLLKQNTNVQ